MRHLLLCLLAGFLWMTSQAQSMEEMAAMKEAKAKELTTLEGQLKELTGKVETLKTEVADLTDKITPYPRWDLGASGNIGFDFSHFTNWLSKSGPNTNSVNIGFSLKGNANLDQKKYFWKNSLNITMGWNKFDDPDDPENNPEFKVSSDAFKLSSLFGYKLSEKIALSTLGEYSTSLLDNKLNNPGYLDIGAGATWTPVKNLVVVLHPINYNFVFSRDGYDYQSSPGCKIVADYKALITKHIEWKSNLSAFASYDGSDLSNWTWINGLTTSVKGFGIGFDLGLRGNKQESLAANKPNELQSYYILGLSYSL